MQRVIGSVVVSVLLGGFTVAIAQLPPDIMADSYLLRAEQAVRDGNHDRAQAVIQNLILLRAEHELVLPDEFHFKYAQVADAVDLPEQALEAVVKYLTEAGREGRHYEEALELMNKAQDAIEGVRSHKKPRTNQRRRLRRRARSRSQFSRVLVGPRRGKRRNGL